METTKISTELFYDDVTTKASVYYSLEDTIENEPPNSSGLNRTVFSKAESHLIGQTKTATSVKLKMLPIERHSGTVINRMSPDKVILSGYWLNNRWYSLSHDVKAWTSEMIHNCLTGYEVIMLGDSTMVQWIDALDTRIKWNHHEGGAFYKVRKGYTFNITFHRNRLTKVLHGVGPFKGPMEHFEPELINRLPDRQTYMIIIGLAAHYASWPLVDYKDRLHTIKIAVQKLRRECNEQVVVVIKKAQARDHPTFQARVHSNNWVFEEMNRIMIDVFSDVDAIFVDIWDMVLSYPSKLEMHMPMDCIQNEVDLFLTQVCSIIK